MLTIQTLTKEPLDKHLVMPKALLTAWSSFYAR